MILFDLTNPSSATSGDLIFGPLISSDFSTTFFCTPSNNTTSLFGVEYDELFLNKIDFSKNKSLKLLSKSSLKFC